MALALALGVGGCDPSLFGSDPPATDAGSQPASSVVISPLATAPPGDAGGRRAKSSDASGSRGDAAPPPPKPYDPNETLKPEALRGPDASGLTLVAYWKRRDPPPPAKVPQLDDKALEDLARSADGRWEISLTTNGRMRADVSGRGFSLPPGTALLAQVERYGHLLLWPGGQRYRVLAPGVLRTVMGEGRVDVNPTSRGKLEPGGEGERLGLKTHKLAVASSYGTITLESAPMIEAGLAAPLLCRALVEMVGVDPNTEACVPGEVLLSAELRWNPDRDEPTRGPGIDLVVTELTRRGDLDARRFLMPPAGARLSSSGLPAHAGGRLFSDAELARLRTQEVAAPDPPDPKAPERGLRADNRSDFPMLVMLDGLPAVLVAPWSQVDLPGPKNGRYSVQWRSLLGERVSPTAEYDLPARVVFGKPDATETPDAG